MQSKFSSCLIALVLATGAQLLHIESALSSDDDSINNSNELRTLYEHDQADRMSDKIDWKVVSPRDEQRQKRVRELMNAEKIKSAEDFFNAAMVMQHGSSINDLILAHILACAAAQKGSISAHWLSAASFDRLMHRLDKPQVFGTQYQVKSATPDANWTMDPYEPTLIPDSVRKDFGARTAAEARAKLDTMLKEQAKSRPPKPVDKNKEAPKPAATPAAKPPLMPPTTGITPTVNPHATNPAAAIIHPALSETSVPAPLKSASPAAVVKSKATGSTVPAQPPLVP